MAKDVTKNPFKFDAAAQGEGLGPYHNGIDVEFPTKLKVDSILIDAGAAGGSFEVLDEPSGISLTGALVLAANEHQEVAVKGWVKGVYMESLADGQILVKMASS